MELTIKGKRVPLTMHKSFSEVGELSSLRDVSQYPPMLQFIAACEERGPVPRSITVRSIGRMAHRVVDVLIDVTYNEEEGTQRDGGNAVVTVPQPVHLTSTSPAVFLPIVMVNGERHAVLIQQRRLATGYQSSTEAVVGVVGEDGQFTSDQDDLLALFGVHPQEAITLGPHTYTIGNEGEPPYTIFTAQSTLTPDQLAELHKAVEEDRDSAAVPVVLPLSEVFAAGDAKASLAAALCLQAA